MRNALSSRAFTFVCNTRFQAHQIPTCEFDSPIRKLKANSALYGLNRDSCVRVMFLHF